MVWGGGNSYFHFFPTMQSPNNQTQEMKFLRATAKHVVWLDYCVLLGIVLVLSAYYLLMILFSFFRASVIECFKVKYFLAAYEHMARQSIIKS